MSGYRFYKSNSKIGEHRELIYGQSYSLLSDFTTLGEVDPHNLNVLYGPLEFVRCCKKLNAICPQGFDQVFKTDMFSVGIYPMALLPVRDEEEGCDPRMADSEICKSLTMLA